MISIDLKNAFDKGSDADNFTVLLMRLIAKADSNNLEKLRKAYPLEVLAVYIYKKDCPYTDDDRTQVDWDDIERRAFLLVQGEK